jgi:hypothetical protein
MYGSSAKTRAEEFRKKLLENGILYDILYRDIQN